METVRKTYKEKLRPTPEKKQALDVVLWRCRTLYKVHWSNARPPGNAVTSR